MGAARLRHSLNARICHWVMVVAVAYLAYSGVMIFLHFPELYWGKVGFRGHPYIFALADWGISWDLAEEWGDRRWGRSYHYLFAWVFLLNGAVYLIWNVWQRRFYRKMLPTREELAPANVLSESWNKIRFKKPNAAELARYNVLQKLAYLIVLFGMFPFMIVTGFAQMPAFTAIAPELIDLFGGRQTARTLHVVCTVLLTIFVIAHLTQVVVTGARKQLRGMVTGKFDESEEAQS